MQGPVQQQMVRVADAGAATSIALFGVSLATWNEIVQIIAGLVAIFAGLAAGAYHISKWRHLKSSEEEPGE